MVTAITNSHKHGLYTRGGSSDLSEHPYSQQFSKAGEKNGPCSGRYFILHCIFFQHTRSVGIHSFHPLSYMYLNLLLPCRNLSNRYYSPSCPASRLSPVFSKFNPSLIILSHISEVFLMLLQRFLHFFIDNAPSMLI